MKSSLLVRSIHLEPDVPEHTLGSLQAELESMAGWLGLHDVVMSHSSSPISGIVIVFLTPIADIRDHGQTVFG